jgi:hypothetical protein
MRHVCSYFIALYVVRQPVKLVLCIVRNSRQIKKRLLFVSAIFITLHSLAKPVQGSQNFPKVPLNFKHEITLTAPNSCYKAMDS